MAEEDDVCPECGGGPTVTIYYGDATDEVREWIEKGDIIEGGFVVDGDAPDTQCRNCGHRWVS